LVRTGRLEGQLEHWLKAPPEQVVQSGWQVRQEPEAEKLPEGHVAMQRPPDASWLLVHDVQKVDDPAQALQDESQAKVG